MALLPTGTLLGPACPEDVLEGHYQVHKKENAG